MEAKLFESFRIFLTKLLKLPILTSSNSMDNFRRVRQKYDIVNLELFSFS